MFVYQTEINEIAEITKLSSIPFASNKDLIFPIIISTKYSMTHGYVMFNKYNL